MKLLDPLRDQVFTYNLKMQEELYKVLAIPGFRKLNMSYYYGVLIKEYKNNPEFFTRIQPYINDSIFENRKNIQGSSESSYHIS
jgi:hypothetical protein